MAKQLKKIKRDLDAPWRKGWPTTPDVRAWMECLLVKADFIEAPRDRAFEARLAIHQLAKLGLLSDSLAHVERLISGLPPEDGFSISRMLDSGAEISFNAGDHDTMNKYLGRILDAQPLFPRKCDRGCCARKVRRFKTLRGLLAPDDATNEEERIEAHFTQTRRLADEAIAAKDYRSARQHLIEAEKRLISFQEKDYDSRFHDIITRFAKADNFDDVQRLLDQLDPNEKRITLNARTLLELGKRELAINKAETEAREALDELRNMTDPNVHFSAMRLQEAIEFLLGIDEREGATRWLYTALNEGKRRKFKHHGFASAAVFSSLAKATAKIDGKPGAEALLQLAMSDANDEKQAPWRLASIGESIKLIADIGEMEKAIELSRKIRSPATRRLTLAPLLAKVENWGELHEVLGQVATALEAARLCWRIKFVWCI